MDLQKKKNKSKKRKRKEKKNIYKRRAIDNVTYMQLQRRMDLTASSKSVGERKSRPKPFFFASGCMF